jgi:hypothetical protein
MTEIIVAENTLTWPAAFAVVGVAVAFVWMLK